MFTRSSFKLFASAIAVSFLAFNCTVTTDDDDDDGDVACTPGETRDCTCSNGESGSQKCSTAGTRFLDCVCEGSSGAAGEGGASGGGGGATSGGVSGGGTTSTDAGSGGVPDQGGAGGAIEAGAGGASGGAAGEGGSGGEGGGGLECTPDTGAEPCEVCILDKCCAEFFACYADEDCAAEFDFMAECTDDLRTTQTATPFDVEECANTLAGDSDTTWSTGLNPLLPPLLNCMAGDTNDSSWPSQSSWSASSCRDGCFAKF